MLHTYPDPVSAHLKKLLFPIVPAQGETILGFITRVVEANYLGSVRTFLRSGNIDLSVKGDYLTKLSQSPKILADLLGLSVGELGGLWGVHPLTEDGKRKLGGVYLRPHQICQRIRRFPPAGSPTLNDQALWMVEHVNFCPVTWTRLIDKCPVCERSLTWPHAQNLHSCGRCNGPLSLRRSKSILRKDREVLTWVLQLFSEDELVVTDAVNQVPTFFEIQSATDVYELVLAFGQAAYGTRFERSSKKGPWTPEHLAAGARMVLEYPRSVWDLYRLQTDFAQPPLLRTALRVARDHSQPIVTRNIERLAMLHRNSAIEGRKGSFLLMNDPINLTHAGRLLSTSPSKVRELAEAGYLQTTRARKNFSDSRVTRSSVYSLRKRTEGWFDRSRIKRGYALPDLALEQLMAMGWLAPEPDLAIRLLRGSGALANESATHLLEALQSLDEARAETGYISLQLAFRGVGGREKPWGPVIAAGINGKLPGSLRLIETETAYKLAIHDTTARAIVMGGPEAQMPYTFDPLQYGEYDRTWLAPFEVEEYLNCTAQDVVWLRNRGHLNKLEHEKPRYCRISVQKAGAMFMTSREAAMRLGIRPQDVWGLLDAYPDVKSIGQGFHDRPSLEYALRLEAPKPCWWN